MHFQWNTAAVALGALLLCACQPAVTDEQTPSSVAEQGTGFDFYVLSLAWSPTYCAVEGDNANQRQCGADRDYAFIAHGLWPQFEHGYPEFCASAEPERVSSELISTIIDIMPSAGLIGHQWRKHGSCTGLGQADYLAAVRHAFQRVTIPPQFRNATASGRTSPMAAEQAFISANAGLAANGIAVTCEAGKLSEVRICMTKGLAFRACPEVDARGCRASNLSLPASP